MLFLTLLDCPKILGHKQGYGKKRPKKKKKNPKKGRFSKKTKKTGIHPIYKFQHY